MIPSISYITFINTLEHNIYNDSHNVIRINGFNEQIFFKKDYLTL